MSINNGDEPVQASSDSFWEVGKYARTVTRIDNGYKLCSSLKQLITSRAEIEKAYAKQLSQWSKKWNDFLDKGPEYGTTQGAWRGVLEESDKLADLHTEVGDKLVNNVTTSIKQWQKENYHKSMMHFKETKELDDQFKKVQKPWEKKLNKVLTAKKDYHAACRNEKSTANQENNARADTAMSSDQLKKLQEKLKKCQIEVESTQEKYNACLNDLNGYNSKYIEDMTEVFEKCQAFERQRIDFFKKIMFDIHQCLDLSVDSRYSSVYTTLHSTISNTDADKDLRWWSNNHGADMAMAWPVFEVPTTGKVTKKKRQYDAGLIAKAYEDVVSSGMSVYKAARLYGIPESTLRDRTLGIQPVTGEKENLPSCGPSPIFTAQEEQKLVEHNSDMASIGYGYTRAEFLSLAFEWAVTLGRKKQSDPEFAASWYTGFKRRNPDFTLAKPQRRSIGTAKTAPSTISIGSTGEEEQSISDNLEPAEHVSFFDSKKILKVLETSEGTRKRRATITCDLSSPSKKMLMTPVEIEVTIKDKNVLELPGPSGEKDVPKKSTKRVQKAPLSPIPGPSGDSNSLESEEDLDSEDITEKDLCCVCGKFTPEPMNMTDTLELVQWGQCDKCGHWTHLKYCCNEYSPDLKPIHGKEKKSQISTSEGGITITSIKQNPDHFVPSTSSTTNNRQTSRTSTHSQQSHSSQQGYNNTVAETSDTVNTNASRQDSYDESLNPFGGEEKVDTEGEKDNANTNAENKSIDNAPAPPQVASNPFGDAESDDEHGSQGSVPTQGSGGCMSVPARVLYEYKAEEEDEISAGAGDIITRLSDQDDMGWVKAMCKDGREGLIPFSYLEDLQ